MPRYPQVSKSLLFILLKFHCRSMQFGNASCESPLTDTNYVSINNNRDIHCLDLSIVRTISTTRKLAALEKEALASFNMEEDEWRHLGELLAISIQNEIEMDKRREYTIQKAINIEERNRLIKVFEVHRKHAAESILQLKKDYEEKVKKRIPKEILIQKRRKPPKGNLQII